MAKQEMPEVAQFELPTPGKPAEVSAPPQEQSNVPPVAQFTLPTQKETTPSTGTGHEVAKGFGKGILNTVRDISGVDTNPVMKDMVSKSPAMQSALDAEKTGLVSQNPQQSIGRALETGAEMAVPAVAGIKGYKAVKGALGAAMNGTVDHVLEAVSPRLTKDVASTVKTTTEGLLKNIVPVATKRIKQVAEAVRPFFNPEVTFSENATIADNALGSEARSLEGFIDEVDHPVVIKELASRLSKIEPPISLRGTPFEKQLKPLKEAAVNLTRQAGGTVKGSFQALRKFDDLVDKTWPTLWDRESAPMRNVVTAFRDEWKSFISENLPKDGPYKPSLEKQSLLYDARDIFREKAALGELQKVGEIGTNALERFGAKHPVISSVVKKGVGLAATGLLGGEIAGHVINSR